MVAQLFHGLPADASPEAQADAHACLLDALGIPNAAVVGVSAGGPSAMQFAIRHPQRTAALVLLVPLSWRPGLQEQTARAPGRAMRFALGAQILDTVADFLGGG